MTDLAQLPSVEPVLAQPRERLFSAAAGIATPAVVYDLPGLATTIARMRDDIETVPGARLNFALKACHTGAVLAHLAAAGVGADVASVGELRLAQQAGFAEISATGPAFLPRDFAEFGAARITVDLDSVDQINLYGEQFPGTEAGLRLRVPLPPALTTRATFAQNSRFGIAITDPEVDRAMRAHRLTLTRLHMHTGQMSPESLLYKTTYTLAIAEAIPTLHTIDLGGGFYGLYQNRGRARAAFARVAGLLERFAERTGRRIALRFEPGAGLLGVYGYLFATVMAVQDRHEHYGCRIVTVDASAWNLAPWHKPTVLLQEPDAQRAQAPGILAGNTLYERDFFGEDGNDGHHLSFPLCRPGERLVITAVGAYTLTNYRRFHRLEPPAEYAFDGTRLVPLEQTHLGL